MKNLLSKWFATFLIIVPVFLSSNLVVKETFAQGGVQIVPSRIVFEGRNRSAQATLINSASISKTFRISFKNMKMTKAGGFEDITEVDPDKRFADGFIRFSPRQVTIPAGGSQTVRLMVRKPKDLEQGEYRSHMLFSEVPKDVGKSIESLSEETKSIKINLIPIMAISIPVIIRHGKLNANIKISDLVFNRALEEKHPYLSFKLNREGTRSIYGDISINFRSVSAGDPVEVGRINGLAVYVPNKNRTLNVSLFAPEGINLHNGTLHVTFKEDSKQSDGAFAEERLAIN